LSVDNQAEIVSVDMNPDGSFLGALTQDRRLLLWDIETGVLTKEIVMPSDGLPTVLTFSADGRELAVGYEQGFVQIWDISAFEQVGSTIRAHDGAVADMVFSPDGKLLATAGEDGVIHLWQAATGQSVGEPMLGHDGRIYDIEFNPNGRLLASAGHDGTIHLWQIGESQFLVDVLGGHTGQVLDLAYNQDGATLVSGSADHTMITWNMTGHPAVIETYSSSAQVVTAVAMAPNGRFLASGDAAGNVILNDRETQLSEKLLGFDLLQIEVLAFSENGQILTAVDQQNSVAQWNGETGQRMQAPISLPGQGWGPIKFSPYGETLLFTIDSGHIGIWDNVTSELTAEAPVQTSVIFDNFSLSQNGRYLAVPNCFDMQASSGNQFCLENNIQIWNLEKADWIDTDFSGSYSMIVDSLFSPNDAYLAAVKQDGSLVIWDTETGEVIVSEVVVPTAYNIQSLQFSPDETSLAIGVETGDVLFWDVAAGTIIGALPTSEEISSRLPMSFSDDSKSFVTGNIDGGIKVWDLQLTVWQQLICNRIQRNLTEPEWVQYMGDIPYRETCAGFE